MGPAGVNRFPCDSDTMESLVIVLVIVLLVFLVLGLRGSPASAPIRKEAFALPSNVTLRARPLLDDRDLRLYNLIRLAVEDHYLVFARVPLWSVVDVVGEARIQVLKQIALKQLDFVLVHPGTKLAEQVVLLDEASPLESQEAARRREIEAVLQATGITLTILKPDQSYTVPQLAQLLGVGE